MQYLFSLPVQIKLLDALMVSSELADSVIKTIFSILLLINKAYQTFFFDKEFDTSIS